MIRSIARGAAWGIGALGILFVFGMCDERRSQRIRERQQSARERDRADWFLGR